MNKDSFIETVNKIEKESSFKNICLNNYEFRSSSNSNENNGLQLRKMLMGPDNYSLTDFAFRQFLGRVGLECPVLLDSIFVGRNNELVEKLINNVLVGDKDAYSIAYIRNNSILAAHSRNYKPLQISELVQILENELTHRYGSFAFEDGFYSDEITIVDYSVSDRNVINAYRRVFDLQDDYDMKMIVRFTTSNLGLSGANLYPFIGYKSKAATQYIYIPVSDRGIDLKHEGGASLEKFRDNASKMFALSETLPEQLDILNHITIEYPTHCCINLAEKVGIPAKYISDVAENISFVYANRSISARQLYMMFADVIEAVSEKSAKFALSEKVARGIRILKENKQEVDVPKIKWKRLQNITANEGQEFIPTDSDMQISIAC